MVQVRKGSALSGPLADLARRQASDLSSQIQDGINTMGAAVVRGTVVAVDANNRVQIRRVTSVNEDGTPGAPDPAYYPVASPGYLPQVGDEVFGYANNGGVIVTGKVAGSGYVDIASVRNGNINNSTLVNAKLVDGTILNAKIADGTLLNAKIADSTIATEKVAVRTLLGNDVALGAIGNLEAVTRGLLGSNLILSAIGQNEIESQAVGTDEVNDASLGGGDLSASSIGTREIATGGVGAGEIADGSIIGADLGTGVVGTRELSGTNLDQSGHTHSSTVFIRYPKEQRLEWLEDRKELQEALAEEIGEECTPENFQRLKHRTEVLGKNLATALQLHYDYKTLDADTREEMFEADPEWLAYYDEEYFVGRWEGYEPARLLSDEERWDRMRRPMETGEQLQHERFPRLPW